MNDTIGFIGGGRMAEALIQGIIKAGLVGPDRIVAADPDNGRQQFLAERYSIRTCAQAIDFITDCTILILAVKPQVMGSVLYSVKPVIHSGHLVISIAAGISISFIEEELSGTKCRVVRVMPNTPALVQEGASALSPGARSTGEDMTKVRAIFDAVGRSVVLAEGYLDAVTGLSGSGPAYVFSFIEALIDGGVKVGLSRADAQLLVLQTVLGSVKLAMETNEHPAQLRAMVTSPGGTTIAGLHELARAGFSGIIMDAVEAATKRSRELGQG
ncbi:MAG: pyrroline-5-carboxylate reductase [Proteobacteria bacterium]|nr:pyrroline-5-carboxylate reductase [Pseudomonadota bacterium]MDP2106218.1 pyrroline-5-carboxylate reductase [Desulfobulbaceae bacterium]